MEKTYAVIMAGGTGTRLWPLSRKSRPKQLLRLVDPDRSMFQIAVDRLLPIIPAERILVIADAELSALLTDETQDIPPENFIVEPLGRDTAPAVGLAAVHVHHRDPDGVMAILTSDHYIENEDAFRRVLEAAFDVAAGGDVVTLGIRPSYPATGFGYIEQDGYFDTVRGFDVFTLNQFIEKPDREKAEKLLADGRYCWNSGMFIWKVTRIMGELQTHSPALHSDLQQIGAVIGTENYDSTLSTVWPKIQRISIDYAVMEHLTEGVRVIPVEMGWADIGDFGAIHSVKSEGNGSSNVSQGRPPILFDTSGSVIYSERLVAAIGLEDIVIIDTEDVLLVCRRDQAQAVRKLVKHLKDQDLDDYL